MNGNKQLELPVWLMPILVVLVILVGIQGFFLYRLTCDSAALNEVSDVNSEGSPPTPLAPESNLQDPLVPEGISPLPAVPFLKQPDWDPFQEMQQMREQMDQLFGDALNRFEQSDQFSDLFDIGLPVRPRINLRETEAAYNVTVEMPGADASTIETVLEGQTLRITAVVDEQSEESTEDENMGSMLRRERWVNRFERSIPLSHPVDEGAMTTEFKDGILSIHLPKKPKPGSQA